MTVCVGYHQVTLISSFFHSKKICCLLSESWIYCLNLRTENLTYYTNFHRKSVLK